MELIKTSEAAEILGISVSTFHRWKYQGLVKPAKKLLTGKEFYDLEEIQRIAESQFVKREESNSIGGID